jgi:hypothetical protein
MSAYIYMTHTHECIHIHDTHTHDYNSRDHQAAQNQQRKGAKPSPSRRGPSFPAVAVIVTSTEECRLTCVTSVGVYARACCAGVGSCLRHSIDLNGASRRRRLGTDRLEHIAHVYAPRARCRAPRHHQCHLHTVCPRATRQRGLNVSTLEHVSDPDSRRTHDPEGLGFRV